MTVVRFEVGRLYCLRKNGYHLCTGLPAKLVGSTWKLSNENHVRISRQDVVLLLACTVKQNEWFIGLANDKIAFFPKDEFVKVRA